MGMTLGTLALGYIEEDLRKLRKDNMCSFTCDQKGVDLRGANLSGTDLSGAELKDPNSMKETIFYNTVMPNSQENIKYC